MGVNESTVYAYIHNIGIRCTQNSTFVYMIKPWAFDIMPTMTENMSPETKLVLNMKNAEKKVVSICFITHILEIESCK